MPETCRGLRHNKVIVKVKVLRWLRYCGTMRSVGPNYLHLLKSINICIMGQDSLVGIATRYWLDSPRIESW
jgi:hypothetical protein